MHQGQRIGLCVLAVTLVISWGTSAKADLDDGLVVCYPFDGSSQDASGNGNDGVINGGVTFPEQGAYFDGTGWIDLTRAFDPGSNDYTVAGWIKTSNQNCYVLQSGHPDGAIDAPIIWLIHVGLPEGDTIIYQSHTQRVVGATGVVDGTWHHVAFTRVGATMEIALYVDGRFVESNVATTMGLTATVTRIGADTVPDHYYTGFMDDFRIYDRALAVEEIVSLASSRMVMVPSGPFAYENAADPNDWVRLRDFEIGKYEVTNAEYCAFLNMADPNSEHWDANQEIVRSPGDAPHTYEVVNERANCPVRFVTTGDAEAYADWLSAITGDIYRLATDQEWEKAAGWDPDPNLPDPNGPLWTYGFQRDDVDFSWCNYDNHLNEPLPVGYYDGAGGRNDAHSFYGCYDMSGNVSEWTSDDWLCDSGFRLNRGGAWGDNADGVKTTQRWCDNPSIGAGAIGFRLVREVVEPEMILVPAGAFPYDSTEDPNAWVWLRSFEIGKHEVTNAEYCLFLNAADPNGIHWDSQMAIGLDGDKWVVQPGRAFHPVRFVTAHNADAYAAWLSSATGDTYRLPIDQEWQKAALFDPDPNLPDPNGPLWTYGYQEDVIGCEWCNYNFCVGDTTQVGTYSDAHSYYGSYDMTGNVHEWLSTMCDATRRAFRGGSWRSDAEHCRTFGCDDPNGAYDYLGFRVVREVAPQLVASDPEMDGTLCKEENNVVTLVFDKPITLPADPNEFPLSITAIAGGPELGSQFTYQIDPNDATGQTLKVVENGEVLTNLVWYRITPRAGFDVMPFALDVATLRGDANASCRVTTADYSEVKAHMGERTDARYDLNGSGRITTADYSVAKARMGDRCPVVGVLPAKPRA